MNMSAACKPPKHAPIKSSDEQHPLFNDYLKYRAAMSAQMVYCQPFAGWLSCVEHEEKRKRGELPYQIIDAHPKHKEIWSYIRHQQEVVKSASPVLELYYLWIRINES